MMMNMNERRFLRYELTRPCYLEWDANEAVGDTTQPVEPIFRGRCGLPGQDLGPQRSERLTLINDTLNHAWQMLTQLAQDRPLQHQPDNRLRWLRQRWRQSARHARKQDDEALMWALELDWQALRAAHTLAQAQHGLSILPDPVGETIVTERLRCIAGHAGRCLAEKSARLYALWRHLAQCFAARRAVGDWPVHRLDLGGGGVGLWLTQDAPLKSGTPVRVFIALAPERDEIFAARGRVSYCRQVLSGPTHQWRVGIDFEPLRPDRQRYLTEHVQAQEVADTLQAFPQVPGMHDFSGHVRKG